MVSSSRKDIIFEPESPHKIAAQLNDTGFSPTSECEHLLGEHILNEHIYTTDPARNAPTSLDDRRRAMDPQDLNRRTNYEHFAEEQFSDRDSIHQVRQERIRAAHATMISQHQDFISRGFQESDNENRK